VSIVSLVTRKKYNGISSILLFHALLSPIVAIFRWNSGACIEGTIAKMPGISGIDFQVRSYDCDTIAKEYDIHVLASSPRRRRQTALFPYVPYRDGDAAPTIDVVGNRIIISIAAVSSVGLQLGSWNGMPIEYRIGTIDYPTPKVPLPAPP
jgi:hypothetical protein